MDIDRDDDEVGVVEAEESPGVESSFELDADMSSS